MNRRLTPAEMDELLGAYALDAVDADEREQIEEYIEQNPRARAEVTEHREVAAMMSLVGGQAPDGVWDRIADEITTEAGGDRPVPQLRLVPVDEKPKKRKWWPVALGSVAAAAIAVLGLTVVHQGQRIDDLEAATTQDSVVVGAAEAMTDPNARLTSLHNRRRHDHGRGRGATERPGLSRASHDAHPRLRSHVPAAGELSATRSSRSGCSATSRPSPRSTPILGCRRSWSPTRCAVGCR